MVDYTLQPNAYQQQLNDPYGFRMYRQMAAGAAMALPDVALGLPALFGNEGAGAMHQSVNNTVNATLNAYISNLRVLKGTALYTANFTPSNAAFTE
jgi:hypothetical protein